MNKHLTFVISSLLLTSTLMAQQRQNPAELTAKTHQQHTMMLLAHLDVGDGLYSTNAKDIIYAFIEGECRGTASPMPQHNGLIFLSIGENSEQPKAIELMVWLDERQELLPINETFTFAPLKAEGELNDPVILTLGELTEIDEKAVDDWFIGKAYPNPGRNGVDLPFTISCVGKITLKIYNSQGQNTYNHAEQISAGSHTISIEKDHFSHGVHILVVELIADNKYMIKSQHLIAK